MGKVVGSCSFDRRSPAMVAEVLLGANWTQTKEKPGEFWVKIEFSAILRIVLRVNFGLRWYVVYQNALLRSIINCHTDA